VLGGFAEKNGIPQVKNAEFKEKEENTSARNLICFLQRLPLQYHSDHATEALLSAGD